MELWRLFTNITIRCICFQTSICAAIMCFTGGIAVNDFIKKLFDHIVIRKIRKWDQKEWQNEVKHLRRVQMKYHRKTCHIIFPCRNIRADVRQTQNSAGNKHRIGFQAVMIDRISCKRHIVNIIPHCDLVKSNPCNMPKNQHQKCCPEKCHTEPFLLSALL